MSVVKKIFKVLGIILLVLIGLVLLAALCGFFLHRVKLKSNRDFLAEQGFYSAASAGDHNLNLISYGGNADGQKIIALGGAGACFPLELKELAGALSKDYQVYYLARPGYDGSDDIKGDFDVEAVVEDYRKALQNAGVAAPYVLMPHSYGSIFASCWVSRYPDEITAMVDLDGSMPRAYTEDELRQEKESMEGEKSINNLIKVLVSLGVGDVALRSMVSANPDYSEDEQRISDALTLMTFGSTAFYTDAFHFADNAAKTWETMQTNDVPKLYICSSNAYRTAEELERDNVMTENTIAYYAEDFTGGDAERKEYAEEKYLEECEKTRNEELIPFAEKLGNCEITDLPGGHFIHREKPEECAEIIGKFLSGI